MMHAGSSNKSDEKKPCRTCTDFRTWAKQQKTIYQSKSEVRKHSPCATYMLHILFKENHKFNFIFYSQTLESPNRAHWVKQVVRNTAVRWIRMNWALRHGIYYTQWPLSTRTNRPIRKRKTLNPSSALCHVLIHAISVQKTYPTSTMMQISMKSCK